MTDYALVFRGHSFGYEVQAIAKIFIPGVRFLLSENGEVPDVPNCLITEIAQPGDPAQILICSVDVSLHGKHAARCHTISQAEEHETAEMTLCTLLYEVLQEMTGYTPPWGMLTGIRPVRKVIQLLDAGKAEHMVQEQLDVFIGENFGLVAQVHGQFAATLIDAVVAFLSHLSFDSLIQVCLFCLNALHRSFHLVQLFAHRGPPSSLILLLASKGKGTGCLNQSMPSALMADQVSFLVPSPAAFAFSLAALRFSSLMGGRSRMDTRSF